VANRTSAYFVTNDEEAVFCPTFHWEKFKHSHEAVGSIHLEVLSPAHDIRNSSDNSGSETDFEAQRDSPHPDMILEEYMHNDGNLYK